MRQSHKEGKGARGGGGAGASLGHAHGRGARPDAGRAGGAAAEHVSGCVGRASRSNCRSDETSGAGDAGYVKGCSLGELGLGDAREVVAGEGRVARPFALGVGAARQPDHEGQPQKPLDVPHLGCFCLRALAV